MDLRATMLGLLNQKPSSGYDLKRIIAESDLFFWSGNNNQIYKILLELQQEQLVTCVVETQPSLPARKVFSITDKGRAALRRSLLGAPEAPEIHKSFLIQLACADDLTDDELLGLLRQYQAEMENGLNLARGQKERLVKQSEKVGRRQWMENRIFDNFIASFETELEWIKQTENDIMKERYKNGTDEFNTRNP